MKRRSARLAIALIGALLALTSQACANPQVIVSRKHLVRDIPARAADGRLHVVVEIPAGTNAKWEVDKQTGNLAWEIEDGRPRVVRYLAYPANYGMVPRTLLPEALGGDGDPLDVVLLGPAVERGAVVAARLVGVLLLLDGGEQDHKLIAVPSEGPLSEVTSLADLGERYPGVTTILETWFASYKGSGKMEAKGYAERARADEILSEAMAAYAARH